MQIREFYKRMGVDYEVLLKRLINDAFVERWLKRVPEDENFALLSAAFETNDAEEAFRAAHTLKGLTANMELHPLAESCAALTEKLRAGAQPAALGDAYATITSNNGTSSLVTSEPGIIRPRISFSKS